jgi:hypothetical protein
MSNGGNIRLPVALRMAHCHFGRAPNPGENGLDRSPVKWLNVAWLCHGHEHPYRTKWQALLACTNIAGQRRPGNLMAIPRKYGGATGPVTAARVSIHRETVRLSPHVVVVGPGAAWFPVEFDA